MSGHSYSENCPNCSKAMNAYSDHRPHSFVSGQCKNCGFCYDTYGYYLNLKELNALIEQEHEEAVVWEENDKKDPQFLTELPEQDPELDTMPKYINSSYVFEIVENKQITIILDQEDKPYLQIENLEYLQGLDLSKFRIYRNDNFQLWVDIGDRSFKLRIKV